MSLISLDGTAAKPLSREKGGPGEARHVKKQRRKITIHASLSQSFASKLS
jgi:hypothetical protein